MSPRGLPAQPRPPPRHPPHHHQTPPQRLLFDAAIDAHSTPIRPSMPIANCITGSSRSRGAAQLPNPDRPRAPLRPSAPPWPPASTAGGAQPLSRHPLQALLLDSPEGPSFPQHAAVDHSRQAGSDRTLTQSALLDLKDDSRPAWEHNATPSLLAWLQVYGSCSGSTQPHL